MRIDVIYESTTANIRSSVSTECDIEATLVPPEVVDVEWHLVMPGLDEGIENQKAQQDRDSKGCNPEADPIIWPAGLDRK